MASEYGFIYILGNESMPGIYKIGFTLSHPKARMDQLSSATACPTPFYMVACFGTVDARYTEGLMHSELSRYRVNQSREFFRLSLAQVQDAIRSNHDGSSEMVFIGSLNFDVETEERDEEQRLKRAYFWSQNCDPIHWPAARKGFE